MKQLAAKALDLFVPRRDLQDEALLRARAFVLLVALSAFLILLSMLIAFFSGKLTGRFAQINLVYVSLQMAFLLLYRRYGPGDVWPFAYHSLTLLSVAFDCVMSGKSLMSHSLAYFPATLLVSFVTIGSVRMRTIFFLFGLCLSLVCVAIISRQGFFPPYDLPPEVYADKMMGASIFKNVIALIFMHWYIKAKSLSEERLARQLDTEIESTLLQDINSLIDSIFPAFPPTLSKLRKHLRILAIDHDFASDTWRQTRSEIAELHRLSDSLGWIYRAYRFESVDATALKTFLRQLQFLAERKIPGKPPHLRTASSPQPYTLSGDLPSLLLLLMNLTERILQQKPAQDRVDLEIIPNERNHTFLCRLIWQESSREFLLAQETLWKDGDVRLSPNYVQLELIRDLIEACQASAKELHTDRHHVFELSVPLLLSRTPEENSADHGKTYKADASAEF